MALAFQILGPIRVHRDSQPLRLPTGRPTSLLATLLVHGNQALPTETLVDELWGGRPPVSAVANLRSHISQLRALLCPTGSCDPPRLIARDGGYLLWIEPGELDATAFERLAAEGHAAYAKGQPALAAELLDRALSLWRTTPSTSSARMYPHSRES